MRKVDYLNRRLVIALREADDADRVWRATMDLDAAQSSEAGAIMTARRLHAVWQEREAARERVADLQRRLDAARSRRPLSSAWHWRRRA